MRPFLAPLLALAGLTLSPFLTPETLPLPTQAMAKKSKLTPCLWFQNDAEEAMRFYVATFPDARVVSEVRWGEGGPLPEGSLMTASFQLAGQEFRVLNGCPGLGFNASFSLSVDCETQEEVDRYWEALTKDGGKPGQCGWLEDKYGFSWQIVPRVLGELMADEDAAKARRVGAAMMQMGKLDIRRLKEAADKR
jgi:predicted 3-demethylubiquinone-9 3-methyltransferase (glyoxalase superfamily)